MYPRRPDAAAREAKYQRALENGHGVIVLIAEVWGGFTPEAMRYLGELVQSRNDGIDIERSSATWSTSSFTSYHVTTYLPQPAPLAGRAVQS